MQRFGSDKPDLRIAGMELQDLSGVLEGTTFAPYAARTGRRAVEGNCGTRRRQTFRAKRSTSFRSLPTLRRRGAGLDKVG